MKLTPLEQMKLRNRIIDDVLAKYYFPSYEIRILLHIIRKTIGYNQTHFYSSYRQLAKATRMPLGKAHETCKALSAKNIIATRTAKPRTHIELNPNIMTWRLAEPETLFSGDGPLPEQVTLAVTQGGNASEQERMEVAKLISDFKDQQKW